MGRSFREMTHTSSIGADKTGANRSSEPEETVRGGSSSHCDNDTAEGVGSPRHGPGFPARTWGRDEDGDNWDYG